jgi:hypothetical protein
MGEDRRSGASDIKAEARDYFADGFPGRSLSKRV